MAQVNAGRVRFISRGEYNNSTQYYLFDLIDYNGSSYFAKENTQGNLPTNTTYWQLVAEKGNTGNVGPTGATGNGISSINKTSTSGLVDTYTITYTNGTISTFTVTNGQDGEVTEEELQDIYEQMSSELETNTVTGTEIQITDGAYWKTKIQPKGNTSQESYQGYNFLPNKSTTSKGTKNDIDYEINSNGTIKLNGTASAYTEISYSTPTGFSLPAGSYKLVNLQGTTCYFYGEQGNLTFYNTQVQTLSEAKSYQAFIIQVQSGTTINLNSKPMILGGTYASSQTIPNYEPYVGGQASPNPDYPQNIKVVKGNNTVIIKGKNLFNKNDPALEAHHGKYHLSGNISSNELYTYTSINVKELTNYTYSGLVSTPPDVTIFDFYHDNTYLSRYFYNSASNTIQTPANCNKIYFSIKYADIGVCQLEEGSTATTYVEHKEQNYPMNLGNIELCNGDYSDFIFKNEKTNPYYDNTLVENAWYKKAYINKRIYNENANFQLGSESTNDYYIFQTAYKDDLADLKEGGELVCDNFVFDRTEGNYQKEYVSLNTNAYTYVRFHISANRLSEKSVEAFKNWLTSHNITIYYPLETPTNIQITDSTLIAQLEELLKAKTYQGISNISQNNSELPFILTVDYKKSNLLRIQNLENT